MFRLDRYLTRKTQTHITIDEVNNFVSVETRQTIVPNWRNIKNDVAAVGRKVWGWVCDAVAIDESVGVWA